MFLKDFRATASLFACPICKSGGLALSQKGFACSVCGTLFPVKEVNTGAGQEAYPDFRMHKPSVGLSPNDKAWEKAQQAYINYHEHYAEKDIEERYLDQIASVTEVYTREFRLEGSILDVGGHQGRVRHFLSEEARKQFVIAEPFPEAFLRIADQPNLLKAFPALNEPTYFVAGQAEQLPIQTGSFDWVHMRSALDHFFDPYLALKEAYRVLKPEGQLMIGLQIEAGKPGEKASAPKPVWVRAVNKLKAAGLSGILHSLQCRIKTMLKLRFTVQEEDHMFHLTHADLIRLLEAANFKVTKEYWLKPPNEHVIYLSAVKVA